MKKLLLLLTFVGAGHIIFTAQDTPGVNMNKTTVEIPPIMNRMVLLNWCLTHGVTPPDYVVSNIELNSVSREKGNSDAPKGPGIQPNLVDQGPDVIMNPNTAQQIENSIGMNEANPLQAMVSTNGRIQGSPVYVLQPWFFTVTGGTSWFGSEDTPPSIGNNCYGDPVAIWSKTGGRAYYACIGRLGGLPITSTTNLGTTWSAMANCDPNVSGGDDKEHAMTDLSGVYPNNVYCAWTDFNVSPWPIQFTYSSNQGVNWSSRRTLLISGARGQGCDIATGPNGEVYVCWAHYFPNGASSESGIGFAKSTDGGNTFNTPAVAFSIVGVRNGNSGLPELNGIRATSFPDVDVDRSSGPRRGWVYICYDDKSTGDHDIYIHRSTDGGATWGSAIMVNSDPAGKQQYFPGISVDASNGNVCVSYYNMDSTGFWSSRWLAISVNGGTSWDRGKISDIRFIPQNIACPNTVGAYMGDYYQVAAASNRVLATWSDDRLGVSCANWKAYVSPYVAGPLPAHDIAVGPFLSFPSWFQVNQNYSIRTRVSNVGTSNETGIPVRWFINGSLTNTTNINLNTGASDSVSNNWMPTVTGNYTLMYVSALATDTIRYNDTLRTTVTVHSGPPPTLPPYCSTAPCAGTYTPITGTPGPSGDDFTMTVSLPFTFNYVGVDYTQASICTNGWVALGSTSSTTYTNDLCSTSDTKLLAPFWDDLVAGSGQIVYTTLGSSPNRIFVVQYTNVPFFGGGGSVTMQCRILENGGSGNMVQFVYGPASPNLSASGSVGIIDAVGGVNHFISLTPANPCSSTTSSTTACNNSVPWNTTNMAPGVTYFFTCPLGISPISSEIPNVYSLAQNYPNPFNPATKISYGLPKEGNVKLVIYDVLGREVKTLVDEFQKPGKYSVDFNASEFASGVYFYKIVAGDFTDVKKMVLMK